MLLIGKLEAAGTLPAADLDELKAIAAEALPPPPPTLPPLQAIGPLETFGAYMLVCLLAALLVSAPVLLHELWKFVAAGLYANERRIVTSVLPWSIALFFAGLAFGYYVLAELSVRFLVSYGDLEHVRPQVAIGPYLGLLFLLLLAMGLVFQVPLVMTVLSRVGLASPAFFRKQRKICILAIFIVAAIITPPDYVSQILVAVPMMILFELGILFSAVAARRRESSEKDAARA
jgi:sec-independent protein translocase protein TatC